MNTPATCQGVSVVCENNSFWKTMPDFEDLGSETGSCVIRGRSNDFPGAEPRSLSQKIVEGSLDIVT